jgi:hypothetical protein
MPASRAGRRARSMRGGGPRRGPLFGIPVGVKDIFDTADLPTEYGSPIYQGHRPAADAACIAAARAAGAVILGKTVTTEFATMVPAATVHPKNPKHTPGGSSSGSAAAVAAGMVRFAFGTQTVGSIIRPAAYCGVVGYKPSFGTLSRSGMKMGCDTLDTAGVIARSVDDAALLVAGSAMRSDLLEIAAAEKPELAVCRSPNWHHMSPEGAAAFEAAAKRLAAKGARLVDLELDFPQLDAAASTILVYEMARALAYEITNHRARVSPMLLERSIPGRPCRTRNTRRRWRMRRNAVAGCAIWRRGRCDPYPKRDRRGPARPRQHRQHRDESPVDVAARPLRHRAGGGWSCRAADGDSDRRPVGRGCTHPGGGQMGRGGALKIESIASAYFRLPLDAMGDAGHGAIDSEELITVKLRAGGLEGHGYAYTIGRGGRAVHALIEHELAPLLAGRDATDIQSLWDLMWQRLLYVGRGGLASFAIAALDIALWDLRGLRERKPLYALLGAKSREIPAYGSGVDLPKPIDELLKQTESFLARGLPGVKVKVGKRDRREDEARIAAVRRLIGDGIDLMVDANMGWSADEALERGRRLEQFNLYWYEEPTIPEDVAGHARLARELQVPIAVGRKPALAARVPSAMWTSARSKWCRSTR